MNILFPRSNHVGRGASTLHTQSTASGLSIFVQDAEWGSTTTSAERSTAPGSSFLSRPHPQSPPTTPAGHRKPRQRRRIQISFQISHKISFQNAKFGENSRNDSRGHRQTAKDEVPSEGKNIRSKGKEKLAKNDENV